MACIAAVGVATCSPPEPATLPAAVPLELQVRNAGLPGGYIRLAPAAQGSQGRWHKFGMAEFICVTCPTPFVGSRSGYDILVLDTTCQVKGRYRTDGGQLLVDINIGPTVSLVKAQPITDWLPAESAPIDAAEVPCAAR